MGPNRTGWLGTFGSCEKCGRTFESRNAVGVAAQHFEKCGGRISLEVTRVLVWDPAGEAFNGF